MQMTVRDVAEIFNLSEKTIYRWLKKKQIPAYRVHDQYRFNRSELLEWAANNKIDLNVDVYAKIDQEPESPPVLSKALEAGGIFYRIAGEDKESALRAVINLMRLPEDIHRESLLKILLARENMASTGIGDGFAIPHVRNPIILGVNEPLVSLCFLEKPIDFGAIDGLPVQYLFTLITPSTRSHLHLISRLVFALHNEKFKSILTSQGSRETILAELRNIESTLRETAIAQKTLSPETIQ